MQFPMRHEPSNKMVHGITNGNKTFGFHKYSEFSSFFYYLQFEDLRMAAGRNGNDLQNSQNEIADLNRTIQKLKGEIECTKSQV